MRRLPIYFLLDVSESMVGIPIEQVQTGMGDIVKELRTDPYALETVYISIIVFAGKPLKLAPLIELYNFYPAKIPIGGGTSLGKALNFLMDDMDACLQKTSLQKKGDWKPIVFLFTDGNSTDNTEHAFNRWNQKYKNTCNLIAVVLGECVDVDSLGKITNNVLKLNTQDPQAFKAFFKWVTASIKTNSVSVNVDSIDDLKLASLDHIDELTKIDLNKTHVKVDENYAIILAKCQKTKIPYLIKYEKRISPTQHGSYSMQTLDYNLVGAYPIEESYFELRNEYNLGKNQVSAEELNNFPACPCCGNQFGFSHCSCGNIICTGGESISTCPWCNTQSEFGIGTGNFNINRTQG